MMVERVTKNRGWMEQYGCRTMAAHYKVPGLPNIEIFTFLLRLRERNGKGEKTKNFRRKFRRLEKIL